MKGTVLIVGATSGIGRAIARACAAEGRPVVLAGRDEASLDRVAADCRIRFGVAARSEPFDALDFADHAAFAERGLLGFGQAVEGAIVCHGAMPDEALARRDIEVFRHAVEVNYTSTVSVLERLAERMAGRSVGFLCAVTSVAGDRGRPKNHLYGSTKAAVSVYLQGLRARLAKQGIAVIDARPGIVDTALTWGLPDLPLRARPERVARDILRGIARRRPVVYTPWFWRYVMAIIRWIPDRIFNRLDL